MATLPNIPLLSFAQGEISLKFTRELFRNRTVMVIGELDPRSEGGEVEQLLREYVTLRDMMHLTKGVEEAFCLSRANPVLLADKFGRTGLDPSLFTLMTDTAGCLAAFLEAEGCLPVRASMSNGTAFAAIIRNNHVEHLFVRRSDPSCPTGRLPGCTGCPHFST